MTATDSHPLRVFIDQRDRLLSRYISSALETQMPRDSYRIVDSIDQTYHERTLQFLDRPDVDWDRASSSGSLVSMYQECAVLTVKHLLDSTIRFWTSKHPSSVLASNFQLSDTLEIDYADYVDEALCGVEAGDLGQRLSQNEGSEINWWVLKPSFGDRRDGIRLFATRKALETIFREWEEDGDGAGNNTLGISASSLRVFVAQPYIHPPFTLDGLKFGIRTYVVAAGNLRVFVARHMYVRCAAKPYVSPTVHAAPDLDAHLASTDLVQQLFWDVDDAQLGHTQKERIFQEICAITGDVFRAASDQCVASFPTSSCAFEVFGVDFMVDANMKTWLLEINAGPAIGLTSPEIEWTVQQLYKDIVNVVVKPYFGLATGTIGGTDSLVPVLVQDRILPWQESTFRQGDQWR